MSAIANGNRGSFNSSRSREGADRPTRCCAKCRTPYWCGNVECACHPQPPLAVRLGYAASTEAAA